MAETTAILRYMTEIGTPPADRVVTMTSGKYTFTSDDLPVLVNESCAHIGWVYGDELIEIGDVLNADDGEVIELTAYWSAAPMPANETGTEKIEKKYLGEIGLSTYDARIKNYINERSVEMTGFLFAHNTANDAHEDIRALVDGQAEEVQQLLSVVDMYLLNLNYDDLIFDTEDIVIDTTTQTGTTSVLGRAILGQMVLA